MGKVDLREEGWIEIGKRCSAGRRSVWVRFTPDEVSAQVIEACAGREGNDAYIRIDRTNPQWHELYRIFESAVFAADF